MKTTKLCMTLAILPLFLTSCISDWNVIAGKGNIITESRSATNFTTVELQSAANVEIVKGNDFSVNVSDYDSLVQYTVVKVDGNRLIIKKEPEDVNIFSLSTKVTITMPDSLYSTALAGSGKINIDPSFTKLNSVTLLGSGLITIRQNCQLEKLNAQIMGSGVISAKGTVNDLTCTIGGSGSVQFVNLVATKAKCTITGSGSMFVSVVDKLDILLTGSGSVFYSGNPTVSSSELGSGKVYKR